MRKIILTYQQDDFQVSENLVDDRQKTDAALKFWVRSLLFYLFICFFIYSFFPTVS